MASLRRAISPMHRDFAWDGTDSRPNGGQISLSAPHKPFASPAIDPMDATPSRVSILSFFGYIPLITITSRFLSIVIQISPAKPSKTSERSSKARVLPWRRLAFQFFLFFVFGFFVGFSPLGTMDSSAILPPRQAELSFDFNPAENELIIRSDEKSNNSGSDSKKARKIEEIPVDSIAEKVDLSPEKLLIVVTPTYNRAFQAYYLNRLGHTLSLVPPPILWIVVEMGAASMETAKILRGTGVMYRHLVCKNNMTNIKDRGVHQRNTGIEHIRKHQLDGIVYFADDDNLYSLDLFYILRSISRFGTWPVGMLAQNKATTILEGPVCKGKEVVGWHTNEKSKILRRFHVDMSGFAFNSTILWDPSRWHRLDPEPIAQLDTMKEGFQETTFIAQLVEDESQMEGLPDGCSRIMSWHLHLENHGISYPRGWLLNQNLDVVLPINHE